jgi:hypothetical protein
MPCIHCSSCRPLRNFLQVQLMNPPAPLLELILSTSQKHVQAAAMRTQATNAGVKHVSPEIVWSGLADGASAPLIIKPCIHCLHCQTWSFMLKVGMWRLLLCDHKRLSWVSRWCSGTPYHQAQSPPRLTPSLIALLLPPLPRSCCGCRRSLHGCGQGPPLRLA